MDIKTHKLSNQALGAVMMALQESLLNELDIVPILRGFELVDSDDGLVVKNPPTVRVSNNKPITEQDLTILDNVMEMISEQNTNPDNIIIIKSTVIPGTTRKYIEKYPNLNIVFNPEFLTERTARLDFINAARIVIGGTPGLCDRVEALYRDRFIATPIIKTDTESAEFIKYMCNCFFAAKVSYMNEMHQMARAQGLDWQTIMVGFLSDGRIGNSHTDVPGHDGSYGFGGKCFPKDINAFIKYFEQRGIEPKILKASWAKNLEVRANHDWLKIDGAVSNNKE